MLWAGLVLALFAGEAEAVDRDLKIVTFGTSLTKIGGWQEPLRKALASCTKQEVKIEVIARSGVTSDWAVSHVDQVISAAPDIILIEFYANDAALNRYLTLAQSRSNMEIVMDELKAGLPKTRVISMVMNPMFGMRGWIRPFLGSYISAHRDIAFSHGFEILDHTAGWSRLSAQALVGAIPDGVHPSAEAASSVMVPTLVDAIAPTCDTRTRSRTSQFRQG